MRIFRATYRDKDGKKRTVKKWWIETKDHLGTIRRFAGHTDEKQTKILGDKIDKLIVHRKNNEPPDDKLSDWLTSMESKLRIRLVDVGILTPDRATIGKALSENINDYRESLTAREKSQQYIKATINAVRRFAVGCSFNYWMDITAGKVESYLKRLREKENGISYRRSNAYLMAIKMFTYWMIEAGRASESPIRHLKALDVELDRRRNRRALSLDEIRRLLETTTTQPERFGMSGAERSLLYKLAIETGLRANELRTLKVSSFNFENRTVTVEAKNSKRRRKDKLPLRKDMASELQVYFANKLSGVQAFRVPYRTADMLKIDLEAAGIPYVDESGRYADFHSLRHATGTLLAASGVQPKVAQTIMRHSTIDLTMNVYAHPQAEQKAQAVESIPDLSLPSRQAQQAIKNLA
jgi:integrase